MARRAKLRQVVSAVYNLNCKQGVLPREIHGYLRAHYGMASPPDYRQALKAAVAEGFVTVRNHRFYPATSKHLLLATPDILDMRRRRRRKGGRSRRRRRRGRSHSDYLVARRRRRRGSSRRRRRRGRRHADADDIIGARRRRRSRSRRRRRGRRHADSDDIIDARRRRRRSSKSSRRRRRRGRMHDDSNELVEAPRRRRRSSSRRRRRRSRRHDATPQAVQAQQQTAEGVTPVDNATGQTSPPQ